MVEFLLFKVEIISFFSTIFVQERISALKQKWNKEGRLSLSGKRTKRGKIPNIFFSYFSLKLQILT